MTRIPELEQQLVAAAQRRRGPRGADWRWAARRALRPALAAAGAAAAVAAAINIDFIDDRTAVEPAAPVRVLGTAELRSSALDKAIDEAVSYRQGFAWRDWTVVGYQGSSGSGCTLAAFRGPDASPPGDRRSCADAVSLADVIARQGAFVTVKEALTGGRGRRIVFGFTHARTKSLRLQLGSVVSAAGLHPETFYLSLTRRQEDTLLRRGLPLGSEPSGLPVRLFAAEFPAGAGGRYPQGSDVRVTVG